MKLHLTAFLLIVQSMACAQTAQAWNPTPTAHSAALVAQVLLDGLWAPSDARMGAFDESGRCVGAANLFSKGAVTYGALHLYGDDPATPAVEGLTEGERFSLRLLLPKSGETLTWYGPDGGVLLSGWTDLGGARLPGFADPNGVVAFHTGFISSSCHSSGR